MPYQSRQGAMKIVESICYESLYGQVVIYNASNQLIDETFTFDKLEGFKLVNENAGKSTVQV